MSTGAKIGTFFAVGLGLLALLGKNDDDDDWIIKYNFYLI